MKPLMLRVLKAFFPAVLLTYMLASIFSTQVILGNLQGMGVDVSGAIRLSTTFHDLVGLTSSYLVLILIAFILGLPVAAGLTKLMPDYRLVLFVLAGFVAIVALHLIMKAVLGLSGIAATRTMFGLL
ncbi:MAG: hypothetical protein IMF06_11330, partial [Proteobacteria bacterium]|nr:hypothetical protein [Pseudomonadota bacterium]